MHEHTPTPWYWTGGNSVDLLTGRCCYDGLYTPDGTAVMLGDMELLRADAEYIVRCVNTHAELLAACKEAVEHIHAWHGDVAWDLYQQSPEMRRINGAIANAEQGEPCESPNE